MSEWRPIETAPKGDLYILGWWPDENDPRGVVHVMTWETQMADDGPQWVPEYCEMPLGLDYQPTHWMPLPDPPKMD